MSLFGKLWLWIRRAIVALISPLVEKNPIKQLDRVAPITLSMARCAIAAFCFADVYHIYKAPTIGWPEATMAIGLVFAPVTLRALDKLSPQEVTAFYGKIIDQLGKGEVAQPPFPGMDQGENNP